MKHAVRTLIIVLLVIFGQFFSKSTFAETLLKVGVYNCESLVFYTEKGDARGLFIDAINEIAEQEEWTIEYVPGS